MTLLIDLHRQTWSIEHFFAAEHTADSDIIKCDDDHLPLSFGDDDNGGGDDGLISSGVCWQ